MKQTEKEINAMQGKSQDIRYGYSLKRIADNDCLWVLARLLDLVLIADELIDSLCENGMSICVFPVSEEDRGRIVGVNTFAEDLAVELENYK